MCCVRLQEGGLDPFFHCRLNGQTSAYVPGFLLSLLETQLLCLPPKACSSRTRALSLGLDRGSCVDGAGRTKWNPPSRQQLLYPDAPSAWTESAAVPPLLAATSWLGD